MNSISGEFSRSKRWASRIAAIIRGRAWFYPKLTPLLAVAYMQMLLVGSPFGASFGRVLLIAATISCLATYGYLVNDLFDLQADRRAGKTNTLEDVSPARRTLLLAVVIAAGLAVLPFVGSPLARAVLVATYALATAYSAPPVRLKERGMLGVIADAMAVHALPTLYVVLLFAGPVIRDPREVGLLVVAPTWALLLGLRGILTHQVLDHDNDVRSGTQTLVTRIGPRRARAAARWMLFPAEITAFLVLVGILSLSAPAVGVLVAVYGLFDGMRHWLWGLNLDPAPALGDTYMPPADLYQAWLPLGLVTLLAVRDPRLAVILALHVGLFFRELKACTTEIVRLVWAAGVRALEAGRELRASVAEARTFRDLRRPHDEGRTPRPGGQPMAQPRGFSVFVATPFWTLNGVNVFTANLVRELRRRGVAATILLTEQDTDLVRVTDPLLPLPEDIPSEYLPVGRQEGWGAHWGAMIRFLEEHAPCIYIPNSDWRHSSVCPLLSDRVGVVGIVHSDDPLHYDHVSRLGRHWNAIVTVSKAVAVKTALIDPSFAKRIVTIPIGVNVAERLPERPSDPGRGLEIMYHGLLVQRQKRILDLPKIMDALVRRGVPARLTLVGGGAQEEQLKDACRHLTEQGRVRFLGVRPNEQTLGLLEESDVFIMTSEFEGMPNALLEAMGRGCVPVVTNIDSGIPEVVRDGENGYLMPVGDIEAFAERLAQLQSEPGRRREMSASAYRTIDGGSYRTRDMAQDYRTLFGRVLFQASRGEYRRPHGVLSHPPTQVAGVGVFPVECHHSIEGFGSFPTPADARAFAEQMSRLAEARRPALIRKMAEFRARRRSARIAAIRDFNVVVGLPYWVLTGVSVFSEHLVRGLRAEGISAEILLTEQDTELVSIPDPALPLPEDVPVQRLPVGRRDGWGRHWGAMIRYLEERAPCVYIPNFDWRHSCVTPRLSRRVATVGVLHSDDPLHYDHLARLGAYWDGIVAVSQSIAGKAAERYPTCAPRLTTIPYGVSIPTAVPERSYDAGRPLRVIYCGVLNQHQKRIFDLPRIVRALKQRSVPAVLTIVGGGSEDEEIRRECRDLVEEGLVSFLGVLPNQKALRLLAENDVFIMTSGFEGLPNALLEAMGRGCVPVVTAIESGIPELVRNGVNGYQISVGDIDGFADRLAQLQREPVQRRRLSDEAYRTVSNGTYRTKDMVQDYLQLFQSILDAARRGEYRRPQGALGLPPAKIGGTGVFPVDCPVKVREGSFPTVHQVRDFREEIRLLREGRLPGIVRLPVKVARRVAGRVRSRLDR